MSDENNATRIEELEVAVIRFAGDSGDGMQLTGTQFSNTTAHLGNDLSTFPDYPSEIRAPLGTVAGVSSFQIKFGATNIHTPGDRLDTLVAMNPAALKVHLKDLKDHGILIVNKANFTKKNLGLAGYDSNPLEDDSLSNFRLIASDITKMLQSALKDLGLSSKLVNRSQNMFALGLVYQIFDRSMETTFNFLQEKFKKNPTVIDANTRALKAGYNYAITVRAMRTQYKIKKMDFAPGVYRNVLGNEAIGLGLVAAAEKAGLELFLGGYPITPASDILHQLSGYRKYGVKTFQAEDEIAGVVTSIGASYAGDLAVTATSGPGMALKTEGITLAVSTELPLVIVNVQRGGPSTGMPTKSEQSDLFQAIRGRNGETPVIVIAAQSTENAFITAFEACKLALEHMMPVILLSDANIANGSEPWKVMTLEELPEIKHHQTTNPEGEEFLPFKHDEEYLARPWAIPGNPNTVHRIGGLEKSNNTGHVDTSPQNHVEMSKLRQEKLKTVQKHIPDVKCYGANEGELLVLGWGSTFGPTRTAVTMALDKGYKVGQVHLRHLNPFPKNLGEVLKRFKRILIPEMNLGQLTKFIRATYFMDPIHFGDMTGKPISESELFNKIVELMEAAK